MVRLRVLTADKRMPSEDASAGFGEGLRTGRRYEKTREENPQHKSNALARATVTAIFIPIEVEADEGTFRIEFSATDDYDPNPIVSAVLLVPSMVDLAVEFHVQDEVKLEFDLEDNKVEIKGPNPEEEWSEIQIMGGIAVLNEQIIKVEVKEGLKYAYKYEEGELKIEVPEIILRVTAIDASGNEEISTTSPTFVE